MIDMTERSSVRLVLSMEMETWFSREVGRDGLLPRNTAFADGMRRSVTKRLPQGAPERMAARLGKGIRQIYHEHASETTYSLDVWMAGLLELPYHESRMLLRRVARPIRGLVIEDPSFFDEEMN